MECVIRRDGLSTGCKPVPKWARGSIPSTLHHYNDGRPLILDAAHSKEVGRLHRTLAEWLMHFAHNEDHVGSIPTRTTKDIVDEGLVAWHIRTKCNPHHNIAHKRCESTISFFCPCGGIGRHVTLRALCLTA